MSARTPKRRVSLCAVPMATSAPRPRTSASADPNETGIGLDEREARLRALLPAGRLKFSLTDFARIAGVSKATLLRRNAARANDPLGEPPFIAYDGNCATVSLSSAAHYIDATQPQRSASLRVLAIRPARTARNHSTLQKTAGSL